MQVVVSESDTTITSGFHMFYSKKYFFSGGPLLYIFCSLTHKRLNSIEQNVLVTSTICPWTF